MSVSPCFTTPSLLLQVALINVSPAVPVDYGCVFGISKPCAGIEPGASNSVFKKHASYVVNGGPEGRVYWFYFFKLARRVYGDAIPEYTAEDERKVLAAVQDDDITPNLKFSGILENKITSVLVPLQEYVFRKWYFGRVITIGDAAHKVRSPASAIRYLYKYKYVYLLLLNSSTPSPATAETPALSPQQPSSTPCAAPSPPPPANPRSRKSSTPSQQRSPSAKRARQPSKSTRTSSSAPSSSTRRSTTSQPSTSSRSQTQKT